MSIQILTVGIPAANTQRMLLGLAKRGCAARSVATISEARLAMAAIRFSVVLAPESLPDGRGYDLAPSVANQAGSLFVCIALSESFLWLPVVEGGTVVLGQRALKPTMIEFEVESALGADTGGLWVRDGRKIESASGISQRLISIRPRRGRDKAA